ncbi:hypothetical protein AMJ80_03710 [bacterium SM23_31]|nr:MAG: hypothetical protein AMJ80_03710 [bacterium SM23_31]
MKDQLNTLKVAGLFLIAIFLFYANLDMINTLFLSDNGNNRTLYIKNPIIPANNEIADLICDIYFNKDNDGGESQNSNRALFIDNLHILDNPEDSKKLHICLNGEITGYVYIIYEFIPSSNCSDINYLLITDTEYRIINFIFLCDMIDGKYVIPYYKFEQYTNQFLNKNLITSEFENINIPSLYERYFEYFKKSIVDLQTNLQMSYKK